MSDLVNPVSSPSKPAAITTLLSSKAGCAVVEDVSFLVADNL